MSRRRLFCWLQFSARQSSASTALAGWRYLHETCKRDQGQQGRGQRSASANKVQPVLQDNCYGCHQPAKAEGGYQDDLANGTAAGAAKAGRRPRRARQAGGEPTAGIGYPDDDGNGQGCREGRPAALAAGDVESDHPRCGSPKGRRMTSPARSQAGYRRPATRQFTL